MTLDEFKKLVAQRSEPPEDLPVLLSALWHDARGDWDTAHGIAQDVSGSDGSWVHAYLHRKEGDLSNARYWYGRAGKPECQSPLPEEWEQLVQHLIGG